MMLVNSFLKCIINIGNIIMKIEELQLMTHVRFLLFPFPQWGCHEDCHVGSEGRAVSEPFCPEEHTCWSVVMQTSDLSPGSP